jgi:homoserine O-acetyltransferase
MTAYRLILASNLHAVSFFFSSFYCPDAACLPKEIATITYRSGPEWDIRFGRQLQESPEPAEQRTPALCADFLIETYLDHQASPYNFL